ncbi:pilus assembly protein TadG-related protein [Massilia suwonensis]|uniref:Pilus assembly protein TadG-related protein n=1 Tax=Massilia suwonensis TaxID=648895 RepID=A0ABW0MMQ6_9BURK
MSVASHTPDASRGLHGQPRQRGSVAVMFIVSVIVIFGFFALALDLSRVYNRTIEMQNVADTVALAAAAELNGTAAGVSRALLRASERFVTLPGTVVGGVSYNYSTLTMEWSDAAIAFGTTPAGPWVDAGTAAANSEGLLFARVDTGRLDPAYGDIQAIFLPVLAPATRTVSTAATAVAGRSAIKVVPMGVCAMRPERARDHKGELEEYGFRRGAAYDLMQLNPESTAAGSTFLIDPLVPPGTVGAASATSATAAAPFICTGTMAMARVTGGDVVVSSPFPLSELFSSFNSRFENYTAPCTPASAPPDTNIKEYKYDNGSVPWMSAQPLGQAAAQSLAEGKRWTVVGPDDTPAGTTNVQYGPLWSYAKAARFSAYSPGVPEPANGYGTFGTGDWGTLYSQGTPTATGYPTTTPYAQTSGQHFRAPGRRGVSGRRVLNVPLLACPVTGNHAAILGIGRFFMTVQADATTLVGEFGGLVNEQSLGSNVKLYP